MFIHCWDIWRNRCYVLPFFWLCKVQFIYSINSMWMEEGLRLQNKSELFAVMRQRPLECVAKKNLVGTDVDVCLCGFHIWKDENSLTSWIWESLWGSHSEDMHDSVALHLSSLPSVLVTRCGVCLCPNVCMPAQIWRGGLCFSAGIWPEAPCV